MKSAHLHYSFGEVFKQLEKVCFRNGFLVLNSNEKKGEINAVRGWKLFGNKTYLHLKVSKKDKVGTKVDVVVKMSGLRKENKEVPKLEEKVVDTIYKFF